MTLRATLACALLFAFASANCGGKAGGTYTGTGGSQPGAGGSKSTGGSSSSGGSSSGGSSSGGVGGCGLGCPAIGCGPGTYSVTLPGACCPTCVSSCDEVVCDPIRCAPGYQPVVPAGQCCAMCSQTLDCSTVVCPDIDCLEGSHQEVPDGECCPVCVPNDSCENGRAGWQALYDQRTTELDAFACEVTEDCTVTSLGGLCQLDCGTAMNTASAQVLGPELVNYASTSCASCPVTDVACPPVVYTAVCTNNVCTLSP